MAAIPVNLIFSKFHFSRDAENGLQHRSRFEEILNYLRGYASGFFSPAALLGGHFEHPSSLNL